MQKCDQVKCDWVNQLLKLFWKGGNSLLENPWSATVKNCTWSSEIKTHNTVAVRTARPVVVSYL